MAAARPAAAERAHAERASPPPPQAEGRSCDQFASRKKWFQALGSSRGARRPQGRNAVAGRARACTRGAALSAPMDARSVSMDRSGRSDSPRAGACGCERAAAIASRPPRLGGRRLRPPALLAAILRRHLFSRLVGRACYPCARGRDGQRPSASSLRSSRRMERDRACFDASLARARPPPREARGATHASPRAESKECHEQNATVSH